MLLSSGAPRPSARSSSMAAMNETRTREVGATRSGIVPSPIPAPPRRACHFPHPWAVSPAVGPRTAATAGQGGRHPPRPVAGLRLRDTAEPFRAWPQEALQKKHEAGKKHARGSLFEHRLVTAAWIPAGRFTAIKGSAYYVVAWTAALAEMDYRRRGVRRCPRRGRPLCIHPLHRGQGPGAA